MNGQSPSMRSNKANMAAFILGLAWDCGWWAHRATLYTQSGKRLKSQFPGHDIGLYDITVAYSLKDQAKQLSRLLRSFPDDKKSLLDKARRAVKASRAAEVEALKARRAA